MGVHVIRRPCLDEPLPQRVGDGLRAVTQLQPRRHVVNDVLDRLAISRSLLLKLRLAGNFPKEVLISEKRKGFIESEIVAWMEARIALRDQAAA